MTGSIFNPTTFSSITNTDAKPNFFGKTFVATVNTTTNNDIAIVDDSIFEGIFLAVKNATIGDKVSFILIDKDNVLGFGANYVVSNPATDLYPVDDQSFQGSYTSICPIKIVGGLYLRISYTSTSLITAPTVVINLKLHTILW